MSYASRRNNTSHTMLMTQMLNPLAYDLQPPQTKMRLKPTVEELFEDAIVREEAVCIVNCLNRDAILWLTGRMIEPPRKVLVAQGSSRIFAGNVVPKLLGYGILIDRSSLLFMVPSIGVKKRGPADHPTRNLHLQLTLRRKAEPRSM